MVNYLKALRTNLIDVTSDRFLCNELGVRTSRTFDSTWSAVRFMPNIDAYCRYGIAKYTTMEPKSRQMPPEDT